ncbi:MAG: PilZ domain-containing protein [Acidobacteriaceae bacterium]
MERKHYYAYNKTREAFLSLGVSVAHQAGGSFWAALSKRELKTNEGIWVSSSTSRRELGFQGPCDRIFLDSGLRVVALTEGGMPSLPAGASLPQFESILLLPVHTIFGSQTQVGDQVLIGTIEDIGAILDGIEPIPDGLFPMESRSEKRAMEAPMKWLSRIFNLRDRRRDERRLSPPLMAFYWDGGIPVPHAVPDISRTGLFLKTPDRWHPRTLLRVTLQRRTQDPLEPEETITVQCRVVRAGHDGVGMAFMLADGYRDGSPTSVGRLASRKDLHRFFERLALGFNDDSHTVDHPFLPFPNGTPPGGNAGDTHGPSYAPRGLSQDTTPASQAS